MSQAGRRQPVPVPTQGQTESLKTRPNYGHSIELRWIYQGSSKVSHKQLKTDENGATAFKGMIFSISESSKLRRPSSTARLRRTPAFYHPYLHYQTLVTAQGVRDGE